MPTMQNLSEIKAWMTMEKGTFFNWCSIESAFKVNCLVIATIENEAVGFFALAKKYPAITIDLAEIHPLFRKNNIATRMLSAVIEDLKRQNFHTLDLMCAPSRSESIWRKRLRCLYNNPSKYGAFDTLFKTGSPIGSLDL